MNLYPRQFLGMEPHFHDFSTAAVALLPIPYEGGISYGVGTAQAPEAVIHASPFLEMYDEVLMIEPYRIGVATMAPAVEIGCRNHLQMVRSVYDATRSLLEQKKFVIGLGGDHSVTNGYFQAIKEVYPAVSVIQLDAHADLRDSYEGSIYSHACTMARIRQHCTSTLQIGIRSISVEEANQVRQDNIPLITMHHYRKQPMQTLTSMLCQLHENVFITLDVDVFDWSVIASTGTPEPGGFFWDEMMDLLSKIFETKHVVGFDVVELSHRQHDHNSAFAVAKLIYKMVGMKLLKEIKTENSIAPDRPCGPFFRQFVNK
ncbi:MAG: agmatinase [Chitinivibrionales bacterium]|nr:agmatinase [Chitinivibrionales bacterium]